MTNALLPNGLGDLLSPQAAHEAALIEKFMQVFTRFGYQRVKPPLVEFEDSLFAEGPGQALSRNTFRLMDPVSQRMMGLRADTTPQIARIAGTRLAKESRPLRLSYAADVLRVTGTQLRPERQFCQVGCELIGAHSARDDAEAVLVSLLALSGSGISHLSADLTVPTLLTHLYNAFDTPVDMRTRLSAHIDKRDHDALMGIEDRAAQTIARIMMLSGDAAHMLPQLQAMDLPDKAGKDIAQLAAVIGDLREALNIYGLQDVALTIDPLETRGFEYQKGVSFTLFSKGVRGELGRGGRYDANGESATGFTFYMDTILRSAPEMKQDDIQTVPAETSWNDIKILQDGKTCVQRKL